MNAIRLVLWAVAAVAGVVHAQPSPVFPAVSSILGNDSASMRLEQDRCYVWGTPNVAIAGNAITVTQSVTPIAGCTATGTDFRFVQLGNFPPGDYRVTYVPVPVGFGPMPTSVAEFTSRPASSIAIVPADPVAMEPIEATVSLVDCEAVSGVRFVDGAIRIEIDRFSNNLFVCDAASAHTVTIGAYPPGTYRVEVALIGLAQGVVHSRDVVVSPGARSQRNTAPDRSGLWFSPNEEPSTGLTLIHTRASTEGGNAPDSIIAIWYRYAADGSPSWYWVETVVSSEASNVFSGAVYAYSATNPASPPWQRTIGTRPVGEMTIRFEPILDQPARVTGTVDGRAVAFSMQRLRWLRAAWPPYLGLTPSAH